MSGSFGGNHFILHVPLLLFFLASCASYQGPSSYTVLENVPYAESSSSKLIGDIYIPSGKGKFPGVVLVHGGGWHSRSKDDMGRIAVSLATHGFIVLNINYRLSPQHTHPAPIEDLEKAIKFMNENSDKFKLYRDKIGLWGYSSGGHTVTYYALTRAKDPDLSVEAVVSGGAPYDFTWYSRDPDLKKYIGKYRDEALVAYQNASATSQVTSLAPPFFLYHAENDDTVEFHQMPSFEAELKLRNVSAKAHTVKFWGHVGTFLFSEKAIEESVNFLIKHLR